MLADLCLLSWKRGLNLMSSNRMSPHHHLPVISRGPRGEPAAGVKVAIDEPADMTTSEVFEGNPGECGRMYDSVLCRHWSRKPDTTPSENEW